MLPDTVFLLTILLLLVAFIVAARTWLAWNALAALTAETRRRTSALEAEAVTLPRSLTRGRRQLATANAAAEQAIGALPNFDARLHALSQQLRGRRQELDDLRRGPLASARRGRARVASIVRMVVRLARLRRTVLG